MILLPIDINEENNYRFEDGAEGSEILKVYPDYYKKVGFIKPWIGYFATENGTQIVGAGGFKGAPKEGKVEIAYGTFERYRAKGVASKICDELVKLALKEDSSLRITARTLQDNEASKAVLEKNGFECLGIVYDEEDGDVLEWEWRGMMNDEW